VLGAGRAPPRPERGTGFTALKLAARGVTPSPYFIIVTATLPCGDSPMNGPSSFYSSLSPKPFREQDLLDAINQAHRQRIRYARVDTPGEETCHQSSLLNSILTLRE